MRLLRGGWRRLFLRSRGRGRLSCDLPSSPYLFLLSFSRSFKHYLSLTDYSRSLSMGLLICLFDICACMVYLSVCVHLSIFHVYCCIVHLPFGSIASVSCIALYFLILSYLVLSSLVREKNVLGRKLENTHCPSTLLFCVYCHMI